MAVPKKDKEKDRNLIAEATKEMNAGKYGRASALLKEILAAEPKNVEARRLFATLHLKTGNLITAKGAFDTLVKAALDAQDYWLAESLLREYLAAGPRYIPFLGKLGEVLERKGDPAGAAVEYGKAIEVLVEDPDPDQPTRASELFSKIKSLAPTSPVARRWAQTFEPPPPPSAEPAPEAAPSVVPGPETGSSSAKAASEAPPIAPEPSAPRVEPPPPPPPVEPRPAQSFHFQTAAPAEEPAQPKQPTEEDPWSVAPPAKAGEPRKEPAFRLRTESPGAPAPPVAPKLPPAPSARKATRPPRAVPRGSSRPAVAPSPEAPLERLEEEVETGARTSPMKPAELVESTASPPAADVAIPPAIGPAPPAEAVAAPAEREEAEPVVMMPLAAPEPTIEAPPPPEHEPVEVVPPPAVLQAEPVAAVPVEEAERAGEREAAAESVFTMAPSVAPVIEEAEPVVMMPLAAPEPTIEAPPPPEHEPVEVVPPPAVLQAEPVAAVPVEEAERAGEREAAAESVFQMEPSAPPVIEETQWGPPSEPPVPEAPIEPVVEAAPAVEEASAPGVLEPPSEQVSPPEPAPEAPVYTPWVPPSEEAVEAPLDREAARRLAEARTQESLAIAEREAMSREPARPRLAMEEAARPARARARKRPPSMAERVSVLIRWLHSLGAATRYSLVLVALAATVSLLTVGVAALGWLMLEQSPNKAFNDLTRIPPRVVQDPKRNGYFLLLGFGEGASGDPIQAGYANWQRGQKTESHWCFAPTSRPRSPLRFTGETGVLAGWFQADDPARHFLDQAGSVRTWASVNGALLDRYRQWLTMPFDDWGYGYLGSPDCPQILIAHRLYVAEGFAQDGSKGMDRVETEMHVWRKVLAQAKTLSVKMMAVPALNEDLAVLAGLLNRPDFDNRHLPRVTALARSLDQVERSLRWAIQNELVVAVKLVEQGLKPEAVADRSIFIRSLTQMPLPRQRVLNEHADYFDAVIRVSESPTNRLPKLYDFAGTPAHSPADYFTNPISNILGIGWTLDWAEYTSQVVETEARLRLVGLLERIRRPSSDQNILSRIAKAGQTFFDPFTEIPMLFNNTKRRLYSVGKDRKDDNGDPTRDVSVPIPTQLP